MRLQQKIVEDANQALREGNTPKRNILQYIKGECDRISSNDPKRYPNKELPDVVVVSLIQKTITKEQSLANPNKFEVETLQAYLPAEVSDADVLAWVQQNIDFTQFKSPMQAMKPIMAEFAGRVDGRRVKRILEGIQ